MTIKELQNKLHTAYDISNLNRISLTLLNLFKTKQFTILRKIAEIISDCIRIDIKENGRGFNKFMLLYHPDRAKHHLNEIDRLAAANDYDGLLEYMHILRLERIEEIAGSLDSFEDIDYEPVYEWDFEAEGFRTFYDNEKTVFRVSKGKKCNFYDAIKMRVYGHTDIEYPFYYLHDYEEFELSASDINDLDGVQFCIHAKTIDVSDNYISDLSFLSGLAELEELNLSDNEIGFIDPLIFLKKLKILNISNNNIDDITPLLNLRNLEYVNVSGNSVSRAQIDDLIKADINVDF
jgi:hypothetical protein